MFGSGGAGPGPGGAAGGFGTPPFLPSGGGGGIGGLFGGVAGLREFVGAGSSIQLAPGVATTWPAATTLQKLSSIGQSPAALLGGGLLALAGLQRGGLSGLAMTTAGGALIGYKFGGPIGAAIGAGAGAIAGVIRLFVKGAQEKAREKIKATYGVDIRDKGVLRQIVDIAKQGFGGNLDMAIRSQQVRDLVELYALSTGQGTSGLLGTVRPISLIQQGGSLFQSSPGGFSLDRISTAMPSTAGPDCDQHFRAGRQGVLREGDGTGCGREPTGGPVRSDDGDQGECGPARDDQFADESGVADVLTSLMAYGTGRDPPSSSDGAATRAWPASWMEHILSG